MQCKKCKSKIPSKAKFCPKCGNPVSQKNEFVVKQKIGNVKGKLVGTALDTDALAKGLKSSTTQAVDRVEEHGTVIGTVIGNQVQVGGNRQHYHGDIVHGDKIETGNITDSTGLAIGRDNKLHLRQGSSTEDIARMFSNLMEATKTMSESREKNATVFAVKELEAEAQKGEEAQEDNVQKWFSSLAQMAPDIWEVAIDAFANPVKGLSTVFKKVAERAKQEKNK